MRPGLVAIGGLFLALGAVALVSINVSPNTGSTGAQTVSIPPSTTGPNVTRMALLSGTNTSHGTFRMTWTSSAPTGVSLYLAPRCGYPSVGCAVGPPVSSWKAGTNGSYAQSGFLVYPYLLVWTSGPAAGTTFRAEAASTWAAAGTVSPWTLLFVDLAGGTLGAVGAVVIFLGLFLRGGVYRGAQVVPPLTADQVEEWARQATEAEDRPTGPKMGSLAAGYGPPRPGPPARSR